MKAVILAAGRGKRLKSSHSKPLTLLLARTLIDRVIDNLKKAGIYEIIVVYSDTKVEAHLEGKAKLVFNEDIGRESGYSLLKGVKVVGDEDFLLLMSDHIFDSESLVKLLSSKPHITTLCIDRNLKCHDSEDATKLLVDREGNVTNIGKELKEYNAIDTGIFYCTPDVINITSDFAEIFSVTDVMRELALKEKLKTFDITGNFWCDVDTREKLKEAEDMLLNSLIKPTDGIISKHINRKISIKISKFLVNSHLTPNMISFISFLFGLLSAALFAMGQNIIAGIAVQISSILDGCDGEIARLKGLISPLGYIFDAILDRYADMLIFLGIIASNPQSLWLVGGLAMLGSYSISYTGSKAEFKGITFTRLPEVLMNRDMRLFLIFLGGITGFLYATLVILALFTNLITFIRIFYLSKRYA
ncbi:bifunctional IPC transferase and DIPP synthase [archaeon]|nr:bifunctional IPC transferase and DIPP synthase [archaeon]